MNLTHLLRVLLAVVPLALVSACGGGGGGGDGGGGTNPPPATVTVSGRITFDRVPFRILSGTGLNPASPIESPARQVVVEAIDAGSSAVLASTTTDTNGGYSLSVPSSRNIFIRAKAQMLKTGTAPTWNFRVLNNTNSDALYVLDGSSFNSGTSNSTRDLRATTGWGTTSYTGTRAAAPFAILDTVYQAKELVLSASANATFPALELFWSPDNRLSSDFCPDDGNVVSSLYITFGAAPFDVDECNAPTPGVPGIYILGSFGGGAGDTDEFDQHVIAHEFGHYLEDRFGRSDSIGGDHSLDERLDFRLAFGEGWGNAFSAMVLNDANYRDSFQGVSSDGGFSLETDRMTAEGWFSEASVGEILWDIFDAANEPTDTVALGFAPLFSVMTGVQTSTDALTSIFSFADAIRSANSSASAAIGTLLANEAISGTGDFGAGESNSGTDDRLLPIFADIHLNVPNTGVCSRAISGSGDNHNKLGNRKFLRLVLNSTRLVTIQATGAASGTQTVAATDPDIYVHRQGSIVAFGDSSAAGVETISQISLNAGTYIIEVYDYDLAGTTSTARCMNVSVTG